MTIIKNRWYVAAWDWEIGSKPLARIICNESIVMYRKLDGSIVALQDACPHRLLPLSLGIREGDNLRCKYHGLLVGCEGETIEMPLTSESPPKGLCTKVFKVAEKYRYVWIWYGDNELADEAKIPNFWPCDDENWSFSGGYYKIACEYKLLIDNLMDLTHETYVHSSSIGQIELMESPLETHLDGNKVSVSRFMTNVEPPPFWKSNLKRDCMVDRWQICHFVEPSNVLIDVGVAPVEFNVSIESHDAGVRAFVIDAITPAENNQLHYFWGMARNFDIEDKGLTDRIMKGQGAIFAEDLEILEEQQKAIDRFPEMRMRNFSIDSGGRHARAIIERLAKAEGQ